MSLSYVIKFCSDAAIEIIARDLAQKFKYRIDPFHCGRTPIVPTVTVVADEFDIAVSGIDVLGKKTMLEDFSILVDKTARFFVPDAFSTVSTEGQQLVYITSYLLQTYQGNLMLLFNEEQPLLIRSKLRAVINSAAGFWNPSTRAALRMPFDEAIIAIK